MTDELIKRFEPYNDEGNREGYGEMEPCVDGGWVRFPDIEARILADANIIKAAEALARQFEIALCELRAFFADFPGVDYNCPDHNAALAVYRAALEARK